MDELLRSALREPAWSLVALLSLGFLVWRLAAHGRRALRDAARDRRRRRGARGETAALDLLRERGFRIASRQPTTTWEFELDGTPLEVRLRADALVERGGRRWVAEIKSGARAPDIRRSATRRQLLEYLAAYEVDGVLLVDIEAGRIRRVDFGL